MFKREDLEAVLFGAFLGNAAAFWQVKQGESVGPAVLSGIASGSLAVSVMYGLATLARVLPKTAAPFLEFRQMVSAYNEDRQRQLAPPASRAEAEAAIPPSTARDGLAAEDRWRVSLRQFLLAARLCGSMSIRALTAEGYMTSTAYRILQSALKANGILTATKAGTDYAPLWNYGRAVFALKHETLTLPDGEPPAVKIGRA